MGTDKVDTGYFDFANPKTLSPRMFRWISLVPAAMVMPYEFK